MLYMLGYYELLDEFGELLVLWIVSSFFFEVVLMYLDSFFFLEYNGIGEFL